MHSTWVIAVSASLSLGTSCADGTVTLSVDGTHYEQIESVTTEDGPVVPLCALATSPRVSGAGMYRVAELIGVRERDLHDGADDSLQPFTYVHLELIDAWLDAPEAPVARIFGGPFGDGLSGGWSVSLRVGQEVGVFLTEATAANLSFPYLSQAALLTEQPDGAWGNARVDTASKLSREELARAVGDCFR